MGDVTPQNIDAHITHELGILTRKVAEMDNLEEDKIVEHYITCLLFMTVLDLKEFSFSVNANPGNLKDAKLWESVPIEALNQQWKSHS